MNRLNHRATGDRIPSPGRRAEPTLAPPTARRVSRQRAAGGDRDRLGHRAQQFSPGNVGLQLFDNAAATATGLFAIILMFGPVSGAHFNPAVSLVDASFGGMSWRDIAAYIPAQATGCIRRRARGRAHPRALP